MNYSQSAAGCRALRSRRRVDQDLKCMSFVDLEHSRSFLRSFRGVGSSVKCFR